jgi:hypothetical protein
MKQRGFACRAAGSVVCFRVSRLFVSWLIAASLVSLALSRSCAYHPWPSSAYLLPSCFSQSSTRQFGGCGLGLAIVYRLLLLMRGRIDIKTTVGKGALQLARSLVSSLTHFPGLL